MKGYMCCVQILIILKWTNFVITFVNIVQRIFHYVPSLVSIQLKLGKKGAWRVKNQN